MNGGQGDPDDPDELAEGGGGHQQHQQHTLASQLALATQHTATAASSLAALPSPAFFASLRVGEGVDCLDIIGHPQWRHAVILDERHEEQEFHVRWSGQSKAQLQRTDGRSDTAGVAV